MRESHKHLMWFLLAVTAALWGVQHRTLTRSTPERPRPARPNESAPDGGRPLPAPDGGT